MPYLQAFLRHALLAGWSLALAWLGVEWLVPGAVSTRAPVLPFAFCLVVATVAAARWLRPARRLPAFATFLVPCLGLAVAAGLFVANEASSLAWILAALAAGFAGLAAVAFFVADPQDGEGS